jgi:hypothetical protein
VVVNAFLSVVELMLWWSMQSVVRVLGALCLLIIGGCASIQPQLSGLVGGSGSDAPWPVVATADGGFVVAGFTGSDDGDFRGMQRGKGDIFIIKVDSNNTLEWIKTYGMAGVDGCRSIDVVPSGGYTLAGYAMSPSEKPQGVHKGSYDAFVINVDSRGTFLSSILIGGTGSESGNGIRILSDGSRILTGAFESNDGNFEQMNQGKSDAFLMKIDDKGFVIWNKSFGGTARDGAWSVLKLADNTCLVVGNSSSNNGFIAGKNKGESDVIAMRIDEHGDIIWMKNYGGSAQDDCYGACHLTDGGYLLVGTTESDDGDFLNEKIEAGDVFVMKIDSSGDVVWKQTFGGKAKDHGAGVVLTNDGNILVAGLITIQTEGSSKEDHTDLLLAMVESSGKVLWVKSFGGSGNETNVRAAIKRNGDIVVTGATTSNDGLFKGLNHGRDDIFILTFDTKGNLKSGNIRR